MIKRLSFEQFTIYRRTVAAGSLTMSSSKLRLRLPSLMISFRKLGILPYILLASCGMLAARFPTPTILTPLTSTVWSGWEEHNSS